MCNRFVRVAIELATSKDAEITERVGVKWISPSQTQSMPQASAMSASSKASSNAEAGVAPRRISSTKSPKCMARSYTTRVAGSASGRNPVSSGPDRRSGLHWARFWTLRGPCGSPGDSGGSGVSDDKTALVEMLRKMIMIREFDLLAIELRKAKKIYGALHPYVGEEAVAVGVCAALAPSDRITSTHRGHGHCIAKGADINRMMAELFGRVDGYCKGKGGSMHIADFAIGLP